MEEVEVEGEESTVWLYLLSRFAWASGDEAETDRGKRNSSGERRPQATPATGTLPLREAQMESLWECLCRVPDPRSRNARFQIGSILTISAMALLAGRREIAEIARFGHLLTQSQRRKLCLPRTRGSPGFHPVPGYSVDYQMLIRLEAEVFAKVLSGWLSVHVDTVPEALALDGKYIREQIGLLSLVRHEDGTPIAITPIDQKERTERSEQDRSQYV